jgi:hypothetical protein
MPFSPGVTFSRTGSQALANSRPSPLPGRISAKKRGSVIRPGEGGCARFGGKAANAAMPAQAESQAQTALLVA